LILQTLKEWEKNMYKLILVLAVTALTLPATARQNNEKTRAPQRAAATSSNNERSSGSQNPVPASSAQDRGQQRSSTARTNRVSQKRDRTMASKYGLPNPEFYDPRHKLDTFYPLRFWRGNYGEFHKRGSGDPLRP
jgi:hypothetical protein